MRRRAQAALATILTTALLLLLVANPAGATYVLSGDGSTEISLDGNHLVARRQAGGACCWTLGYPLDDYLPAFCYVQRIDNGNGSGPALIWLGAPLGTNCWPGLDNSSWYGWQNGYGYFEGQAYSQGWMTRRAWGTGTVIELW